MPRIPNIVFALVVVVSLLGSGLTARGADAPNVHVRIESSSGTLFDDTVTVTSCSVTDTTGVVHELGTVAACALVAASEQNGFSYTFQDFGFGLFLKSVGDDDTPADFSKTWGFWIQNDPASVGVDSYTVQPDDDILLAYTSYPGIPLRVSGATMVQQGEDVVLAVEKRVGENDADFVWHGRWEPATQATLTLGTTTYTVPQSGNVVATVTQVGTVRARATGEGFIPSPTIEIQVITAATPTPTPTSTSSPTPTALPSPTVTPTPTPLPQIFVESRKNAALEALSYLQNQQTADGSIDGAMVTGWSAIAFGAHRDRAASVKNSGLSLADNLASFSPATATDIERHILAVRAGGLHARTFAGRDLVQLLKQLFKNNQIGEFDLVNDDIFGVLALLAVDEPVTSVEISRTVDTILQAQSEDGAWENLDLTAAAIQALRAYESRGGTQAVGDALRRARTYLRVHQDSRGGFGNNSATTAWGIQAILALGEDPADWAGSANATPWSALLSYRNTNGGFGWQSASDVSPFMTAYAVPALLEVSWPVKILDVPTGGDGVTALTTPAPIAPVSTQPAQVAGIRTVTNPTDSLEQERGAVSSVEASHPTETLSSSPAALPASGVIGAPASPVPVTSTDRQFAFALFSVANVGIGVTATRLISKLFTR